MGRLWQTNQFNVSNVTQGLFYFRNTKFTNNAIKIYNLRQTTFFQSLSFNPIQYLSPTFNRHLFLHDILPFCLKLNH